jgi:hypothetical protein
MLHQIQADVAEMKTHLATRREGHRRRGAPADRRSIVRPQRAARNGGSLWCQAALRRIAAGASP